MDYDLRHPPWTEDGVIPEDVFLRRVKVALASVGRWETDAEFRMGGGPKVSITMVKHGARETYQAQARYLSLKLLGEYTSIHGALEALPILGRAVFDAGEKAWEGLVESIWS